MKKSLIALIAILVHTILFSQSMTQFVRGKVYDELTNEPLPGANIMVLKTDPLIGAASDIDGNFIIEKVPVGRHNLLIRMMGYESFIVNELLVSTGQQPVLDIALQQMNYDLEQVIIRVKKDTPLNTMTTVSSRQFSVEEAQRYAGGMDDPARLASSFAGVATPSVTSNSISVRGNNPQGLLWRIEGVEVPNPNHFADLTVTGGGLLTAVSSHMMGNSDFYTGAFPAEYGNATSGVFDINMNTGNTEAREYTFQAGIMGIDFATGGPFIDGKDATYLVNYRYSTIGLIAPLLPEDSGIIEYQDLAFKVNAPTQNAGTFALWGIGALDGQEMVAADSTEWESDFDRDNSQTALYMFATGLSHKIALNSNTLISTTLSATGNGLSHKEQRVDYSLQAHPRSIVDNSTGRYSIHSALRKRFGKKHSNETGFYYSQLGYNLDLEQSENEGDDPASLVSQDGHSGLVQLYSQSKATVSPKLSFNLGLHSLYFLLNDNFSIEPRVGVKYAFNDKHNIALAYGVHSRIERLPIYFVEHAGETPNQNLDLMKSAHYVLAYNVKLNNNLRLCIEPYYQHLSNVPVTPEGYTSTINMQNDIFFNESLISKGEGRNVGVDITFERFLSDGYYYLLTGSAFDSKYTDAGGITRNTRFNKNIVVNVLAGKEWVVGSEKNNILNANVRLNYMGGNRREPIDQVRSISEEDIIYGETNGELAFSDQYDATPILSVSLSYRKNKPSYSSVWALQLLNAGSTQEYSNDIYNRKTGNIETKHEGIMLPNLSYKIEF